MTAEETKKIAQAFAMYAAYYRVRLEDEVLKMYAEDLSDLDFAEVSEALNRYRRNPKNRQLPLPAQIREVIDPQVDPESAAREIASRIGHAVVKFGWSNANAAQAYIGAVGWNIVERSGGWSYICEHHGVQLDPGVFSAQVRELAKSTLTHDPERLAEVIGLPSAAACSRIPQLNPAPEKSRREFLMGKYRELVISSDPHELRQASEIAKAIRMLDKGHP